MRKLKYIFLSVAILLAFNGYASKSNSVTKKSDADINFQINKELSTVQLPINYGNVGEITELSASGKTFRMVLDIKPEFKSQYFSLDKEKLKSNLLNELSLSGNFALKKFIDIGYGLTYVYRVDHDSSQCVTVSLTPDEVKRAFYTHLSNSDEKAMAYEILRSRLEAQNKSLPIKMSEVTSLDSLCLNDTAFVYNYTIFETEDFSLDSLDNSMINYNQLFAQMNKQELIQQGATVSAFLRNLVLADRSLCYHYVGNKSGKVLNIVFHKSELEEILKKIQSDFGSNSDSNKE